MRLFADDTIVYLTIKSHASAQSLQEDKHNLELWGKEWSIEFNPDKCEVLRIHRKKKPVIFPYTLRDTTLRTTENAKYYGVNISSTLNWSSHINTITNKAKKIHQTKCQNTKQTTKRVCIQNICTPPGRILFNHMAPIAETPHTENRNDSKDSRKVCLK